MNIKPKLLNYVSNWAALKMEFEKRKGEQRTEQKQSEIEKDPIEFSLL